MYRLGFALLAAGLMLAQDPPTIRVSSNLVEVSVVVRNTAGPVRGLTAADFRLLDNGKDQPVEYFSINEEAARTVLNAAASDTFTNRTAQAVGPGGVTIILLDALNTHIADQNGAKRALIRFLRQVQPTDRVAVYLLGTELRVLADFTNDASRLLSLLDRYQGDSLTFTTGLEVDPLSMRDAELDRFLAESSTTLRTFQQQQRARNTCAALEAIADHIAHIPGRKNLVWVTASFPFEVGYMTEKNLRGGGAPLTTRAGARNPQTNFEVEVKRATRALNAANMAVYPVDARGLIAGAIYGPDGRPTTINPFGDTAFDTMRVMADSTGGRAFYNSNDLQGAIRSAVDDATVTYTLGFRPRKLDGVFHKLDVQVKRPGVTVRARRGYVAAEKTEGISPAEQIELTMGSPIEAATLGLGARLGNAAPSQVKGAKTLTIRVDLNDVQLVAEALRWQGSIDLALAIRAADGRNLGSSAEVVRLSYEAARLAEARSQGLLVVKSFVPPEEARECRVVVRDRQSGRIGSLIIPLREAAR